MKLWLPFLMVGCVFSSPALAQSETAKQGEDLAKSVREGSATTILQSGAENSVPGYGGTDIDASKYLDDDEALTDAGVNARYSDPNYSVVIDPTRPEFDPSTIDLSAAKTIEDTPESFLGAGMGVGGSAAACEPLPTSGAAGSTYYETCNQGDQLFQQQQTCTSSLNVRFDRVSTWIYYTSTSGPYVARGGFGAAIADGTCKSKGTFGYCSELKRYGYSPTKDCKDTAYSPEIFECTKELSGLSGTMAGVFTGIDPATGTYWSSKSETISPPIVTRNVAACSYASSAQCVEQGAEVCTDSDPVTRVIDGIPVTQPCWAWSRTFQCTERRPANDCSELDKKPECHFDHNECLSENEDGSCNVFDKVYACKTPDTGTGEPGGSICGGDLYCINGECTQVEREASTEFKDAMVAVQTMGNVRDHFDPETMTLFNGEKAGCHKPVFGLVNCCAGKTSGLLTTAAGAAAIASGPAAIAALATPFLTMFLCDSEEMMLDVKDRMGLCHYVGTYCSDKVLGVCTSKRKNYCCFESKLSRILQEQGRAQIGKSWGKAKEPDCKGFLIEEFQRLDLSKMDFTEVYSEFIDAAKVPDEVQTSIEIQDKIDEYYRLHGGTGN
ncbi:conjugal transfer protein TraN [Novosphingobium sp. AP12]|uniref:conjugal transfer protein TraN n=1 Tax=Novosphingobium sp. AP12 TaxID=1144305 RepID=UPI000271F676|nr:conjugal transfer protein TraN [Novosphingobium sp. AP12]EJL24253.1 Mating pair stabilization protein TraN [Novosphingobium sp. AP12]